MKQKWLAIGIILLFLGVTIAPTINFNTVKASQQNLIQERINQRELLFQTIVDIANNKEIQRIILKAQMSRGVFPESELSVVTKNQIRKMYFLGLILSKVVINSRIQSMVQQYQFNNQNIQMEMYDVIEKDTTLNTEITQLKGFDCDCNNKDTTFYWRFPMICVLLLPSVLLNFFLYIIAIFIWGYLGFYPPVLFFEHKLDKFDSIGFRLSCFWWHFMFSEW
jgi:hypothetical protein